MRTSSLLTGHFKSHAPPRMLHAWAVDGWSDSWAASGSPFTCLSLLLTDASSARLMGADDFDVNDPGKDLPRGHVADRWSSSWALDGTPLVAWLSLEETGSGLPGTDGFKIPLAYAADGWNAISTTSSPPSMAWSSRSKTHASLPVEASSSAGVVYKAGSAEVDITPVDWARRRYWLAGFDPNRPATSVHDPLYARALVVDDGINPMAVVTLDLLGMVSDDIQIIRDAITTKVPELGNRILVHTTHNHEAPDTIGLWGGHGLIPFLNPRPLDYIQAIATKVADAVERSWNSREAVSLKVANIDSTILEDLVVDSRPPYVADPLAHLLIFSARDRVLGTLINWASHPEVLGDQNQAITADFVKWVIDETEAQLGGNALFINGAIGGLLSSSDPNILPALPDESFQKAEVLGREVARRLLQRVKNPGATDLVESLTNVSPISYSQRKFYLPVDNPLFLAAKEANRLPTTLYRQNQVPVQERWRSSSESLTSYIETESNFITLGPVSILTMGGELYPELLVGGIDPSIGSSPDNQSVLEVPLILNPSLDDSRYQFFFGLTNDFYGYVLPRSEWDGSSGGYYGEQFATSADGGSILSYNLHLLMLGYETGQYPDNFPAFLVEPNRLGLPIRIDNHFNGGAGNDTLDGGAGNDFLAGGAGNDTLDGGDLGEDFLAGEEGNDSLSSGAGEDTLFGGNGNDRLNGGDGNDRLSAGNGEDRLDGDAGTDTLIGGAGNDTLQGLTGVDSLVGGTGNDLYGVFESTDRVVELVGGGIDTVNTLASFTLSAEVENLSLVGTAAINGTGNSLNNVISGNGSSNRLDGNAGNDTLLGGAGNDTLQGLTGIDSLIGGTGNDLYGVFESTDRVVELVGGGIDTVNTLASFVLPTEVENLTLFGTAIGGTGNALNNVITGNANNNGLNGGAGNDTLIGGAGKDTLVGSTGNDTFLYRATSESLATVGQDVITDFTGAGAAVGDRIDLASVYGPTLSFLSNSAAFTGLGQVRVSTAGTNSLVQVNTIGSLAPEMEILLQDGAVLASAYTAADFFL
jgi:Ca2+-binding RTX toxin-like protein